MHSLSWPRAVSRPHLLLSLSLLLAPVRAQTSGLFQWQFSNQQLSKSLPSCGAIAITVKAPNSTAQNLGVPPFSMFALPNGGTPTTQLIGTNPSSLSWTVDQPIGAELMLTVIDGNGNPGGVPPSLFTVIAGQSTDCLPPPSNLAPFNVTSNVTTTLTTCQPWGIRVQGGVPPYNVTLAALNSPVITNVTIGLGDDVFTYIDRADPNTQLLAAVSDFQGRWASGTPLVSTQGSADVDCIGLVSSTGNSTQMAANHSSSSNHHTLIISVSVAVGALLLIGAGVLGYVLWRKRQEHYEVEDGHDLEPRQFFDEPRNDGQVLSINSFITQPPQSTKYHHARSDTMETFNPYDTPSVVRAPSDLTSGSSSLTGPLRDRPSFANFPSATMRSNKAMEAGYARPHDAAYLTATASATEIGGPSEHSGTLLSTASGSVWSRPSTSAQTPAVDTIHTGDGEVIFQHRDAGLPSELPPPYADRSIPPS